MKRGVSMYEIGGVVLQEPLRGGINVQKRGSPLYAPVNNA